MIVIAQSQHHAMVDQLLFDKLHALFRQSLPGFEEWAEEGRADFLIDSIKEARACRFTTEIGIASYAMAVWWLNVGFEKSSVNLTRALTSELPEIRRVHMLNEWVSARLGAPADPAAAERALAGAYKMTAPWGQK